MFKLGQWPGSATHYVIYFAHSIGTAMTLSTLLLRKKKTSLAQKGHAAQGCTQNIRRAAMTALTFDVTACQCGTWDLVVHNFFICLTLPLFVYCLPLLLNYAISHHTDRVIGLSYAH